ncbi:MAG: MoaD family protein [Methanomicrobiales archaeon]|nr:MoaD family protein [Methanomicrobiales archaeon]
MKITIKFFARFRERFGNEIVIEATERTTLGDLVRQVAMRDREGYDAIFDSKGAFRTYVIIMQNGRRTEHGEAEHTPVIEGDVIAIFPPVAGG